MKSLALNLLGVILLALEGNASSPRPAPSASKKIEIDQSTQRLRAYEDGRLVIESRVSTGMNNSTPNGQYQVIQKQQMHYSRRYHNAPMPYSVQYSGHYFIHGFRSVPNRPASHGCVRVPLSGENPAKQFFEWVELGTPLEIFGQWIPDPKEACRKKSR
jgi:lipoprotein-anchoring transpeptidase ErfK/SrfK